MKTSDEELLSEIIDIINKKSTTLFGKKARILKRFSLLPCRHICRFGVLKSYSSWLSVYYEIQSYYEEVDTWYTYITLDKGYLKGMILKYHFENGIHSDNIVICYNNLKKLCL